MRVGKYTRKTLETQISVKVNLDGKGKTNIATGIEFFDHLITSLATHSLVDMMIESKGALQHHVIEDLAICLGKALRKAIGDGTGINRFGYAVIPMDCSLASAAIDLVNRPYHRMDLTISNETIEDTKQEDIIHFLETLTSSLKANIHIWVHYGNNDHHKIEAAIKALARSLRQAITLDPRRRGIPSAKGQI